MNHDWTMPRRAECCAACQKEFEIGQPLQAFVYDVPTGYERRDYCVPCIATAGDNALASWRTRRPEPAARKTLAFDRQSVMSFFERLDEDGPPERVQFRFVLALLLWRKKAIKFIGATTDDAGEVWNFSKVAGNEACRVRRPELNEDELERLSGQLEALLSGGGAADADPIATGDSTHA